MGVIVAARRKTKGYILRNMRLFLPAFSAAVN